MLFVPSKVNAYLCAGRPIVLSAPWQNLAGTTITASGTGRVVPPGDGVAMAEAVLAFLDNEGLRREAEMRAREYAEKTFEISKITDRFERLYSGTPRHRLA